MIGGSPVSTDGKLIGNYERIKQGSIDSKTLETILGNVDGITLWFEAGTKLESLDHYFDSIIMEKLWNFAWRLTEI